MNFADIKGISLASGFKLQAESPLDARNVVDTIEERDALVTIHAAYEGLRVYVKANKVIYVYNGSGWTNTNTTYGLATTTANGLLSAADFKKLAKFTEAEAGYLSGVTSSIQTQLNGKAATSHGTHVTYSTSAPLANGTASAGSAATVARSDHRHPLQTSVSGSAGSATNDSKGQNISTTYIKGLSVSGRTITYTKGDGTTGSINTQDTTYGLATASANGLLSSGDFTKLSKFSATEAGYLAGVTSSIQTQLNGKAATSHGTHVTYATVAPKANGTAAVGTSAKVAREDHVHPLQTSVANATKATQDSEGQNISTTYIKNLSVSGRTVTFTRGDGTTGSITTQDTNTTYSNFSGATSSAAGSAGLVPAPAAGASTRYLRSDGTWQVPPNTTYGVVNADSNGLMTPAMFNKLNSIAEDATKVTIDSALSSTSTNPVQNKVINSALAGKANTSHGTHVSFSTTAPVANGTASAGSASTVARSDHRHPLQTSVSGSAGSATNDSEGQNISTTYIKGLSVAGKVITYTKGDGSTGTITTQDTNTTYSNFKAATTSAAGGAGLVPAPAAGAANRYLRSDGTWAVPPDTNTTYNTGNATTAGIGKLYTGTGSATDGSMTQSAITTALNGKAATSHGTHVSYSTSAPKANGTASAGSAAAVARADHVHPLQTSVANATKATQDSAGQNISTTYIKGLSVSGKVITYTRGDGTTGTITTQDTNTTYSNFKAATTSAAGGAGLVPAPAAGAANRYLRSDGTWAVPPDTNTTYSTGTASTLGLTKLYTATGTATDGTMTQAAINTALAGKANTSHGTHVTYATVAPKANGTAAVGTSAKVAREDHVHPLQTSVANATKATQDSAGQNISTTYIKALSVSGRTITYTKGDGTTGTITTQDTNTTYSTGNATTAGIGKLYTATGTAVDGSMTQNAITTALNGKAATSHTHSNYSGKSSKRSVTLTAANWSGSGPYTITVNVTGATTTNNIEVLIPGTATDTQVEAWMNACIVNGTQASGSITLKAYGEKPEIDIPIEVIVRGDI